MVEVILLIPPGNVSEKLFSMSEAAAIGGVLTKEEIRYAILDCDETPNDLRLLRSLAKDEPTCICFVLQWEWVVRRDAWLQKLTSWIRKWFPKIHLNALGRAATIFYAQLLESGLCDSVVRGESEVTLFALLKRLLNGVRWQETRGLAYRLEGKTVRTLSRPCIDDLDNLPSPHHSFLKTPRRYPIAPLYGGRDCHGTCTFCFGKLFREANPNVSGKMRVRSPESVVDEIEKVVTDFGIRQFYFVDDCFMPHGDAGVTRAMEIGALILNRGLRIRFSIECRADDITVDLARHLKKAGLQRAFIGFESGSEPVLKRYRKGTTVDVNLRAVDTLRSAGVRFDPGFIMFDPWTRFEELEDNLEFIERSRIHQCQSQYSLFRSLSILPGSEIERKYEAQGGTRDVRTNAIKGALRHADELASRHDRISTGRRQVQSTGLRYEQKRREFMYEIFRSSMNIMSGSGTDHISCSESGLKSHVERMANSYL